MILQHPIQAILSKQYSLANLNLPSVDKNDRHHYQEQNVRLISDQVVPNYHFYSEILDVKLHLSARDYQRDLQKFHEEGRILEKILESLLEDLIDSISRI